MLHGLWELPSHDVEETPIAQSKPRTSFLQATDGLGEGLTLALKGQG